MVFHTKIIALATALKALFIFLTRLSISVLIILNRSVLLYFIFPSHYIFSLYKITKIIYALAAIKTAFSRDSLIILLKDLRKLTALSAFCYEPTTIRYVPTEIPRTDGPIRRGSRLMS
jgi:hypothetical protein